MRRRCLAVAVGVLVAACSNEEGKPEPVDPPPCYPNCTTTGSENSWPDVNQLCDMSYKAGLGGALEQNRADFLEDCRAANDGDGIP